MTGSAASNPVDGRSRRPADSAAAPAVRPARGTPAGAADAEGKKAKGGAATTAAGGDKPADPSLEGMGGPKCQAAYLAYRNLGPKRSLLKLAETYQAGEGTVASRKRSFERWSSKYGWPEKAQAYDTEQAEKDTERRRRARERMDEDQGGAMSALWFTALDRTNEMILLDRQDQQAYQLAFRDWLGQDPNTRGDPPRPPKPRIGAYALAQLMRTGLEYERIARQAATEILGFDAGNGDGSMLPPVFEVRLTNQRPVDPVDPFEDADAERAGPPAAARAAAVAALPPALAHLATRRPAEPADPAGEEEDGEDGEDDWGDE
jgi:hypothetical protein